jgi:hypothetical protein
MPTMNLPAQHPACAGRVRRVVLQSLVISLITGILATGCVTAPAGKSSAKNEKIPMLGEMRKRKDEILHLSPEETAGNKPVLLLLHGATEDPAEMMDIVREWSGKYDVFLYAYNFHQPVEKVAADFVNEVSRIKSANNFGEGATVVVYSYAAIVFREAVIIATDRSLFSGMSLIQLVPTAGGSHLAKTMKFPVAAWLVSFASKPSVAENPYGRFAEQIWEGDGNRKFYEVIKPERVHTIILAEDVHSLASSKNKKVHEHYENGIGPNVMLIPRSAGVTHDYFPTNPVALGYLRSLLEQPRTYADRDKT